MTKRYLPCVRSQSNIAIYRHIWLHIYERRVRRGARELFNAACIQKILLVAPRPRTPTVACVGADRPTELFGPKLTGTSCESPRRPGTSRVIGEGVCCGKSRSHLPPCFFFGTLTRSTVPVRGTTKKRSNDNVFRRRAQWSHPSPAPHRGADDERKKGGRGAPAGWPCRVWPSWPADDTIGCANVDIPRPTSSPPAPVPCGGLQKWGKAALEPVQ